MEVTFGGQIERVRQAVLEFRQVLSDVLDSRGNGSPRSAYLE